MRYKEIGEMVGEIFSSVERRGDELFFRSIERTWHMYHVQDCCESVTLEDICGDLADLEGSAIVSATEETNSDGPPDDDDVHDDSHTWTFYHIRTHKGTVTLRWYVESNGYYSESVDIEVIE